MVRGPEAKGVVERVRVKGEERHMQTVERKRSTSGEGPRGRERDNVCRTRGRARKRDEGNKYPWGRGPAKAGVGRCVADRGPGPRGG